LKAEREKCQFIYKDKLIRITSDLSAETLKPLDIKRQLDPDIIVMGDSNF
jgi:hypothetical protein